MPDKGRLLFRILDANINRAMEGLRVSEEIARFILRSPALTGDLKAVRHAIARARKDLAAGGAGLERARDTRQDVGRTLTVAGQAKRRWYKDVFSANIQRVKESLRVLEEFSKLRDSAIAARFSRLRFRVYDIEKKALGRFASLCHRRQGVLKKGR